MEKMTKREMYNALLEMFTTGTLTVEEPAMIEFIEKEIAALDHKAEKARENAAKRKATGDELGEAVEAALSTEEFEAIADIAAKVEFEGATVHKVIYRLNQLVKAGKAEKTEITVEDEEGKKRKVTGYRAFAADAE